MGKLTKEEEVLLANYSSSTSTGNSIIFYLNALVISLAPIYLFYGVYQMEINDSWIVWTIGVLGNGYLLGTACTNQKRLLKHTIMMKRGSAVDREVNAKFADKKMSTKEKEERSLFRKNEVAETEATYLSLFFTNVLFLTILLILSFFILTNFAPLFNNLFSMLGSAGLVAFLSTAKN